MNSVLTFFLFAAGLLIISNVKAQGPTPTLSFGLDRVLFGASSLDTEILAAIIADKQDELKKRVVEKEILTPIIASSSFATKNFIFSVVKNLMNEKDKNVLKKELLEQTSNYALVFTLAEMYLQLSWDEISEGTYLDSIKALPCPKSEVFSLQAESVKHVSSGDFAQHKLTLTDSLQFKILRNGTKGKEVEMVNFNNLLLDMIFHAIRSNPTFLGKGFGQDPLYFTMDQYRLHSTYHQLTCLSLKEKMYTDVSNFIGAVGASYRIFEDLILYLENEETTEEIPTDNVPGDDTLDYIYDDSLMNIDTTFATQISDGAHSPQKQNLSVKQSVQEVQDELKSLHTKNLHKDQAAKEMLEDFYFLLYGLSDHMPPVEAKRSREKIQTIFLPKISVLNMELGGKFDAVIDKTSSLAEVLEVVFQKPLLESLSNKNSCRQMQRLLDEKKEVIHLYLAFFSRLDKLDEAETYYYLLKNLRNCSDQMVDKDGANALHIVLNAIDKYTTFEAVSDRISVDIESILLTLVDYYAARERNPVHLYMTLGANNSFRLNAPTSENRQNEESNFAYAAEKLGVRVNLINWQKRNALGLNQSRSSSLFQANRVAQKTLGLYSQDPVVSNLHLLMYGSGLVSRLVHMTNSKNPVSSYLGSGLGLTFFNNLSVNTSILVPIQSNSRLAKNDLAFNVGFDIYFAQYISAMNKKRREVKQSKTDLERYKIEMDYRTKQLEKEMREMHL